MQSLPWDELQDFLAVARYRQLSRAARILGVDPTTVGRRLRRLEARLGQRLFEHTACGHALTPEGDRLLRHVETMERSANRIVEASRSFTGLSGVLKISAAEGFGAWFIARHLHHFVAQHQDLTVELAATSGFLDPSRRETDLAITLARPQTGPVICSKLVDYGLGLYASDEYLRSRPIPMDVTDLERARLIGYVPDLLYASELDYLGGLRANLRAATRSSSITAQRQMIATGLGIGILPHFMGAEDPILRRILPQLDFTRSFWLVVHRETRQLERVRVFKDWLIGLVAGQRSMLLGHAPP